MKNKITALIITAALLLACLTLGVFATGDLHSKVFILKNAPEGATFTMTDAELKEESRVFIDNMFDKNSYNASFYGAYKASLVDADGIAIPFTDEMNVTINVGDNMYDYEIFVFYVNEGTGRASAVADSTRVGANLTISGKDFAAMSDGIIVVMTSNKSLMTGPAYTIVPAVICAGVALIAIVASVVAVRKKANRDTITD